MINPYKKARNLVLATALLAGGCTAPTHNVLEYGLFNPVPISMMQEPEVVKQPSVEITNHTVPKNNLEKIVDFVTPNNKLVEDFVANTENKTPNGLFNHIKRDGFRYWLSEYDKADMRNPDKFDAYQGIQLPEETLKLKKGDCKDLCLLYASLLKNQGLETIFVAQQEHLYVMYDSGLTPEEYSKKTERHSFVRYTSNGKEHAWIPVDIAMVDKKNFDTANKLGKKLWDNGKKRRIVKIK